jgi:hypothetical protein
LLFHDFEIINKKGKHNIVEDALSRKGEETKDSLCSISILQYDLVEEERIQ